MQFSAECIILALPFECNFQITWQKITSREKWIYGGETPLTPIHSALDRERPRMDRDELLQPVHVVKQQKRQTEGEPASAALRSGGKLHFTLVGL